MWRPKYHPPTRRAIAHEYGDLSMQPYTSATGGDDVDAIPPALLTGGGLTGVLGLLILAFIKGWIMTGSNHREIVTIKDQQIADKDAQVVLWRAVGETSQAQTVELLEHSRLTVQLLQGIAAQAKKAEQ